MANKEEKEVKKIEVSEEMLKELIEDNRKKDGLLNQLAEDMEKMRQNSASESSKAGLPRIVRKNSEMFVGLLKYDNKYFIGYVNKGTERKPTYIYPEYDERMREIVQKCDVILLGEDNKPIKPIKLNYVDFLRESEKILVKVKEKKVDTFVEEQGTVFKKDFANNGYGMFETTVQVPVEVTTDVYTYVVELEDGNTIEVPSNALNGN